MDENSLIEATGQNYQFDNTEKQVLRDLYEQSKIVMEAVNTLA